MNLATVFSRTARIMADAPAIVHGDRKISYRELDQRSSRLANGLRASKLGLGDRVGLLLGNTPEWIEVDLALAKIGAITVPLNLRSHPAELARTLDLIEPHAVVVGSDALEALGEYLNAGNARQIIVGAADGRAEYEELLRDGASSFEPVPIDDVRDGRLIRLTSGSTGEPKGVCLTHRNWLTGTLGLLLDRWNVSPGEVYLGASPLSGASGPWLSAVLMRGGTVLLVERFDATQMLELIERHQVALLQLVPTMIRRLLDTGEIGSRRLESLKAISYGSGPIDRAMLTEALDTLGPKLVQGYGLNEAPNCIALPASRHRDALARHTDLQPLGLPGTFTAIRVVDSSGNEVDAGDVGELVVDGAMVMTGYWRNEAATRDALTLDGALRTGDLVVRDDDDLLFLAGRRKEVIVTGGLNVYPQEVEDVIGRHPAVRECAVVGLPDRDWGERVTAFVVLDRDIATEEVIAFCREYLAAYKLPKEVRVRQSLPVGSNGKIMKRLLQNEAPAAR